MRSISKILVITLGGLLLSQTSDSRGAVDLERAVRSLLADRCQKCHGPEKQKGGLRLDSRDAMRDAGDSGEKAIVPGDAAASELIRRVASSDELERMPPAGPALSTEGVRLLKRWIDEGASWSGEAVAAAPGGPREMVVTDDDRRHWSFRPLKAIVPPPVAHSEQGPTPIDRFVLAALEERGLALAPPAGPRQLVRRVSFDLIGLPPSPEDVEAFVADPSPDAYAAMVDRLLASRHHGERWGRHWLDVVRYADSDGQERDADRPTAYHYRDFVIRALNDDLPFDTSVRWQLAGDELEPDDPRAVAATGFLTAGPHTVLNVPMEEEKVRNRYNELDDLLSTLGSGMLGLSIGCARCHDHKYDAIPTRDYYEMLGVFQTGNRAEVPLVPQAEVARHRERAAVWESRLKAIQARRNSWRTESTRRIEASLRARKIDAPAIGAADESLAREFEEDSRLTDQGRERVSGDEDRLQREDFEREIAALEAEKPPPIPTALAFAESRSEPEPAWLLGRGDIHAKKERVGLGFLSVLTGTRTPEEYWKAARVASPPGRSTYQRKAFAAWITDTQDGAGALLARVIVNRVWQHHFGEGLVRTVNDFGVQGELPSHPELLEWLANDFVDHGWRLKRLHRLILRSAVYQQGVAYDPSKAKIDPDNRLLWHRRPLRLESEALRDGILAVSGTLNSESYGKAFKPPIPAEAMVARNTINPYPKDAKDGTATRRRSVYMFHKRVVQYPLMQAFDGPDAAASCGRRNRTTVAPQALALLNDPFVRSRSVDFADRLREAAGPSPAAQVELGYRLALGRPPSSPERAAAVGFLDEQARRRSTSPARGDPRSMALTDFCQALFGLNEFLYVD